MMLCHSVRLVAVAMVAMVLRAATATTADSYGGCGCYDSGQENGYAKCVGVGNSAFDILSGRTLKRLTIDCIGRSEIKSFNKDDVHDLSTLEIFNCGMESIGRYAFDGLEILQKVSFAHNSLHDISVNAFLTSDESGLTALTELDLSNNQLQALHSNIFTHLPSVRVVTFRNNLIETLDNELFINSLALESIQLGQNRLRDVNGEVFRLLKQLKDLYLEDNMLTSVTSDLLPEDNSLRHLSLTGNAIEQLDSLCMRLQQLTTLDLANNKLTSIASGTFQGCSALTALYLHNNMITDLSADAFKNTTKLSRLYLSGNKLMVFGDMTFFPLTELTYLDLRDNNIQSFSGEPFQNKTLLSVVLLSGNLLTEINSRTFGGLDRLNILDVSRNPNLATIHKDAFLDSQLYDFDASHCSLQAVDFFHSVRNASKIDLSHQNQSIMIPRSAFEDHNLLELILNDNNFESFEFLNQTLAQNINLDNTNIKEHLSRPLVDGNGRYHQETYSLSLRRNDIESFEEVAPLLSKNIRSLDLSQNRLLELKISNDTRLMLQDFGAAFVNYNQAASPMQIFPGLFTTTAVSTLSLFGTEFSGLESVDKFFTNLQLGGTSLTAHESDWCVKQSTMSVGILNITHAGLTSVPQLVRAPCAWRDVILSNNKVSRLFRGDFTMRDVRYPNTIDLSHNQIYSIEPQTFELVNLQVLDLSHNDITSVSHISLWFGDALFGSYLNVVDLTHNKIQTLPETLNSTLFSRQFITRLGFNQYHCNCEMHWVTSVICDAMKTDNDVMDGGCVTPHLTAFAEILPDDVANQCISPRIENMESRDLDDGTTLLTCVASGDPLPSVYWFGIRSNSEHVLLSMIEPSKDKASPQTAASLLVSLQETDFASYRCKANTTLPESSVSQELVLTTTSVSATVPLSTSVAYDDDDDLKDSDKKYTAGEMAGAIIATLIICMLLAGIVVFVLWKRKHTFWRQTSPRQPGKIEDQNMDSTDGQNTRDGFSLKEVFLKNDKLSSKRGAKPQPPTGIEAADTDPSRYVQNPVRDTSQGQTPRDDEEDDQPLYDETELQEEYSTLEKRESSDWNEIYEPLGDAEDVLYDNTREHESGRELQAYHKDREAEHPADSNAGERNLDTDDDMYDEAESKAESNRQSTRSKENDMKAFEREGSLNTTDQDDLSAKASSMADAPDPPPSRRARDLPETSFQADGPGSDFESEDIYEPYEAALKGDSVC